jgi:hypothetical protein
LGAAWRSWRPALSAARLRAPRLRRVKTGTLPYTGTLAAGHRRRGVWAVGGRGEEMKDDIETPNSFRVSRKRVEGLVDGEWRWSVGRCGGGGNGVGTCVRAMRRQGRDWGGLESWRWCAGRCGGGARWTLRHGSGMRCVASSSSFRPASTASLRDSESPTPPLVVFSHMAAHPTHAVTVPPLLWRRCATDAPSHAFETRLRRIGTNTIPPSSVRIPELRNRGHCVAQSADSLLNVAFCGSWLYVL